MDILDKISDMKTHGYNLQLLANSTYFPRGGYLLRSDASLFAVCMSRRCKIHLIDSCPDRFHTDRSNAVASRWPSTLLA